MKIPVRVLVLAVVTFAVLSVATGDAPAAAAAPGAAAAPAAAGAPGAGAAPEAPAATPPPGTTTKSGADRLVLTPWYHLLTFTGMSMALLLASKA
ncbi:unnamed protein product [Acanthoscelides obtectus]|uniref:Uncharacterized protein n=1 Tax=Acanthoscelides obtectus TaxID=200917 RepID=A0A9P0LQ62_ACAOB|nr:unnamed protein product [Acanthoscelides obtectus]CAK1676592.1 hypothetical protein AOBTE_LOCUS30839 [Acanthoscelides obtectus]